MVRCQIWCVSKLILHRLTLYWLHTNFMKIIKSTRSYFDQLYSTHSLVQQLCLQHILTTLAQTVGQSGQCEMTLTSPHRPILTCHTVLQMSWRILRKHAFWVRRKAEISEGLLMHERQIKSETSSELVPFSPHPWSKLRLPYKSIHDVAMLPKTPRSNPEACGTHLWYP